jgi:hypothetical protein
MLNLQTCSTTSERDKTLMREPLDGLNAVVQATQNIPHPPQARGVRSNGDPGGSSQNEKKEKKNNGSKRRGLFLGANGRESLLLKKKRMLRNKSPT